MANSGAKRRIAASAASAASQSLKRQAYNPAKIDNGALFKPAVIRTNEEEEEEEEEEEGKKEEEDEEKQGQEEEIKKEEEENAEIERCSLGKIRLENPADKNYSQRPGLKRANKPRDSIESLRTTNQTETLQL